MFSAVSRRYFVKFDSCSSWPCWWLSWRATFRNPRTWLTLEKGGFRSLPCFTDLIVAAVFVFLCSSVRELRNAARVFALNDWLLAKVMARVTPWLKHVADMRTKTTTCQELPYSSVLRWTCFLICAIALKPGTQMSSHVECNQNISRMLFSPWWSSGMLSIRAFVLLRPRPQPATD